MSDVTPNAWNRTDALTHLRKPLPHLVVLGIGAGLSFLASPILAIASTNVYVSSFYPDSGDIALKNGLSAWADILLHVGIVSAVAAVTLAGVVEIAHRVLRGLTTE